MPVLGIVRSPSVEHAIGACALVTEHGGLGHTSAVYAEDPEIVERFGRRDPHGPHPRQRAHRGRRARRRLQRAGADVLARLRHVGRLDDDRERQLPRAAQRQGRLPPPVAAAVVPRAAGDVLQRRRARRAARGWRRARVLLVTDADTEARGVADEVRRLLAPAAVRVFARRRARAGRGGDPRRRRAARRDGRRPRRGRRRRLRDRRREGHAAALRAPRADASPSWRCRSWTRASGSRASRRIRTAPG